MRGFLSPGRRHVAGDGAPLSGIEPAIGAPAETVGDRMRVLDAEALQMHVRVAIGHVVAVRVGIEQQIRRIQHPHAAASERERRGEAQAIDERLVLVELPSPSVSS